MNVTSVTLNTITPYSSNKKINFKGDEPKQTDSSKNDDDKYVKVPKSEYNRGKWFERLFWIAAGIEIIYLLLRRKPEPWDDYLKDLKKK